MRLAAGNHYIIDVDAPETGIPAIPYTLRPYAQQLTLPTPDGAARSLYGADGIILQSRRAERFLFWPLGIPSAGAMRQSGTPWCIASRWKSGAQSPGTPAAARPGSSASMLNALFTSGPSTSL
ncbi:MAG: hypothetical protein LC667_07530, partial [Thioalkalivibrio sp.]|nr:hypothetical protein [Thioalkalivibrio sp.]